MSHPLRPGSSRRGVLRGLGAAGLAGLAAPLLPRRTAAASVSASDRRFIFVQVLGGWDVTRAFAPLFGAEAVSMEPDAAETSAGDLVYVTHPERPSVDAYFADWGDQTVVVNGLYVPSISHHSATRLMLTAVVDAAYADWGTRIATAHADAHVVPYLVAGGANYAGAHGVHIGRAGTNGQLPGLATGALLVTADVPMPIPSSGASSIVDRYLASAAAVRAAQEAAGGRASALESYEIALDRAARLKDIAAEVDLSTDTSFEGQTALAMRALSNGISRCVSISYPQSNSGVEWDTHAANDLKQSPLFEGLFAGLSELLVALAETPGTVGATLADETTVVVLSEMGRTPFNNGSGGKDHWPYTSAMFIGQGVAGGRVIGAFNDDQFGEKIDLSSGDLDEGGIAIGNDVIGATILQLAGLDLGDERIGAEPIAGLMT